MTITTPRTLLLAASTCLLTAAAPCSDQLDWFHGPFEGALAKAKDGGSSLLLYFWKDGSDSCAKLYQESLATDEAAARLGEFLCYSAQLDDAAGAKLFERFGVRTMPTILVLTPEGAVEDGILGYIERDGFFGELERIAKGVDTVSDFRARTAKNPRDLDTAYQLALKLQDLGDPDGHDEVIAAIRKVDPDGKTKAGADIAWRETVKEIFKSTNDPKEVDLAPMYDFLATCKQDETVFAAWDWVSQIEYAKGNRIAMREAAVKAWRHIPDDKIMDWGGETAEKAWRMRDELSKAETKLALEIATKVVEKAEQYLSDHGGHPSDKMKKYLARSYNALALCQEMNGKRKDAAKSFERCIDLDPETEAYQTRLAALKK